MSKQEIIRRIAAKYGQEISNEEIKRIARDQYGAHVTSQMIWNCLGPAKQRKLCNLNAMQLDQARRLLRMLNEDCDIAVRVLRLAAASP